MPFKPQGRNITIHCSYCNNKFQVFISDSRKFCSRKCYELSKRGIRLSEETKAKMRGRVPWNKGIKIPMAEVTRLKLFGRVPWNKEMACPPETRKKISASARGVKKPKIAEIMRGKRGPLASRWAGGKTPKNKILRNCDAYVAWRHTVFARDDYTCQYCGSRGGHLHAHHIFPLARFPQWAFETSNGETLCTECHGHWHRFGTDPTTTLAEYFWLGNPPTSEFSHALEIYRLQKVIKKGA